MRNLRYKVLDKVTMRNLRYEVYKYYNHEVWNKISDDEGMMIIEELIVKIYNRVLLKIVNNIIRELKDIL
jgi:hypothetical protein